MSLSSRASTAVPGLRAAIERRLRDLPPARRLRARLATQAVERAAAGRSIDLLDAGCGEGLLTVALAAAHPDWRVHGVDLDEHGLATARTRAREAGAENLELSTADVTRDLRPQAYDVVLAIECLTEIPDKEGAIAGLASALRPGGVLIANVPEASWKPVLPGSPDRWRQEAFHGFTPEELRELLTRHGLSGVTVEPTMYAAVHAAQEIRDRVRPKTVKGGAALLPFMALAVRLELLGLRPGTARALRVEARRA